MFLAYENDVVTTQRDSKGNLIKNNESVFANVTNVAYKLSLLNFFW